MAVPGETVCREPASCGTGPWGDIPVNGSPQYVDGAYTGGDSDGTADKPWVSVQQGVDGAADGAVVAVAEGTYDETVLINGKAVRLWGICPAKTALVDTSGAAPVIRLHQAHGSEIHALAVSGPHVGIQPYRTTDVLIEGVWVHDLGNLGIDAERSGRDVSITVRDTLVERASWHAVFLYGAEATLERVVVRQTQLNSEGMRGRAIVAVPDPNPGVPSDVTLRRVVSRDNYWRGIEVIGSESLVEDTVVLDIAHEPGNDRGGQAMGVWDSSDTGARSHAVLRRVELGRSAECGLAVQGSSVEAEGLTVHDMVAVPHRVDTGLGVCAFGLAEAMTTLTIRDALIDGAVTGGVITTDTDATLEGVLVRNIEAAEGPLFGRGIASQSDGTRPEAQAIIRGSRVEEAPEFALLLLGVTGLVDGVHVLGSSVLSDASFQGGIGVQMELSSQTPATAEVTRSLVEEVAMVGVAILGAEATIHGTHVRATQASDHPLMRGAGILVQPLLQVEAPAKATIEHCLVEQPAAMGIAVIGAEATIAHCVVQDVTRVDGLWGDGIAVASAKLITQGGRTVVPLPAEAVITSSLVANPARAGFFGAGANVSLTDSMALCAPIPLNGEPYFELPFDFLDAGGNHCGCDGVFPACKVLSEDLTAPEPVEGSPGVTEGGTEGDG